MFVGASARNNNQNNGPARGGRPDDRREFTFRSDKQTSFGPQTTYQGERPRRRFDNNDRRGGRFFRKPFMASDRAILRSEREATPEQLLGMNEGTSKFKALEEVSESEHGSDSDDSDVDTPATDGVDDTNGLPAKRRRITTEDKVDAPVVPKWSNPDPYTSLPPPDELKGKGLDVLKFIRKAKVAAANESKAANPVAANDDFISLNFDDFDEESSDDEDVSPIEEKHPVPVPVPAPVHHNGFTPINPPARSQEVRSGRVAQKPEKSTVVYTADLPPWPPANSRLSDALQGVDSFNSKQSQDNGIPTKPKKRKRGGVVNGELVEEWQPRNRAAATPWCTVDHSKSDKMGFWYVAAVL